MTRPHHRLRTALGASCLLLCLASPTRSGEPAGAPTLERQLLHEGPTALARAARRHGDPARGALVFYQPSLGCAKCHTADTGKPIGPDLARPDEKVGDAYLVESILLPSKVIKKGYEPVILSTVRGTTVTGLLVEERPDRVVLRDPEHDFRRVTVRRADIDERAVGKVSAMPEGLVNQLTSRQQFLDLARYVIDVSEHGPARARELRPDPVLLTPPPLPEYEKHIDHAGMIAGLDRNSLRRGEAVYNLVCVNCHGTRDRVGSMPTSLRFATGRFKNGGDPYAMYETLTRGFGMMTPQSWMVPEQKYDVIHYIREAFLKPYNPSQYARVDAAYLARLPKGDTRGPRPSNLEPWRAMNYGPSLMATYEVGGDGRNFAYKGIAVRLDPGPGGVAQGRSWMLYDSDTLRAAAAWSGRGFIDWDCIHFNGRHQVHPHLVGTVHVANLTGPGWANPADGRFDDVRLRGRDGRHYGPLPRAWAHYRGLYHAGDRVLVSYTVGDAEVLEMPGLAELSSPSRPGRAATRDDAGSGVGPVFTRTFNIGPRRRDLVLQVAHGDGEQGALDVRRLPGNPPRLAAVFPAEPSAGASRGSETRRQLVAGVWNTPAGARWLANGGEVRLRIPAGAAPLRFTLCLAAVDRLADVGTLLAAVHVPRPDLDLKPLTHGGPPRWAATLTTRAVLGRDGGPFAVDTLTHPENNPWSCRMRFTGLDFMPDGKRAAVCDWDGDVWMVQGIDDPARGLRWQRIASGLFQPLGLKVVGGRIYVGCRDEIVRLHDLNGDGETDFYENFNNDHQVTDHFHEFAMGLQTDAVGNFYYCKGGRHALTAVVPQHGTLLRVSKDGTRTDILATGFRAANGVCVNGDGTFWLTDQEGHWTPKNRLDWVVPGGFYGYMWGYTDVTDPSDRAMKQPATWITNNFDRSPAEMMWVDSRTWGPLRGALLNLSYGTGKIFVVPHEKVEGEMQGGMVQMPIPVFPTGVMRGRFHPASGDLYACGMFAWAGDVTQPGGLYRVRYTGKPLWVPLGLHAKRHGIEITFSGPLDPKAAADVRNYAVKTWTLKRTAEYGSNHYNEHPSPVTAARLLTDGKTVHVETAGFGPAQCMEIKYFLKGAGGEAVDGVIHNTIHRLGD